MSPNFAAMPHELRQRPRWVCWKGAKVPYCPTAANSKASVIDPTTWASFSQAQTAYEEGGYSGVGFVLTGDGIVGVDLDDCVSDGSPAPAAMGIMDRVGCQYIEVSPSGHGLRGFGYGDNIQGRRGKLDGIKVELYAKERYLTVTGNTIKAGPLVKLKGFSSVADSIMSSHLQKRTEEDRGLQKNTEDDISHLLSSSVGIPATLLPQEEGQRNRCLFELARHLKGKMPEAKVGDLRGIVKEWHTLALPVIGTKDFAVTWADFVRGFNQVKYPHGETMAAILQGVESVQLPASMIVLDYGERAMHLARICTALQAHHGEAPFFLSASQAGELLGIHRTDANKMMQALCSDGVLTLVSKGTGYKASRYRWAWKC